MKEIFRKVPKNLSNNQSFRKGQAAMEFLAFLILVMTVSAAVYAGVFGRLSDAASSQDSFSAQSACRDIAGAADSAYVFGNGFSSNLTLPQGVAASMLNNSAVCSGGNSVFIESALGSVRNSTGGANFNLGKQIRIANSLGTVIIS